MLLVNWAADLQIVPILFLSIQNYVVNKLSYLSPAIHTRCSYLDINVDRLWETVLKTINYGVEISSLSPGSS